ncbi:MAG: hypothetical protein O7H41_20570 [Planctomycetota bacterium]|nr:hypothetical protein [Planctomycetota bacterium]
MSFAIWFILLVVISLGIGALVEPWLEKPGFKYAFLPGVLLSGICRLVGASIAGITVHERKIFTGHGRGIRVDTARAPWARVLLFSAISFVGPIAAVLVANAIFRWPLRLHNQLPGLYTDSRALVQIPGQMGQYLYDVWILLKTMAARDPMKLIWAYVFLGVLLSNSPGKRESAPLWGGAIIVGLLVSLGLTVRGGTEGYLIYRNVWAGLGLAFAFSLLTLLVAFVLSVIHRTREGSESH